MTIQKKMVLHFNKTLQATVPSFTETLFLMKLWLRSYFFIIYFLLTFLKDDVVIDEQSCFAANQPFFRPSDSSKHVIALKEKKSCCCFNTHSEMFALHVVPKYIHMCSIESKTSIWVFTLITRSYVLRFKCVLSFPQK